MRSAFRPASYVPDPQHDWLWQRRGQVLMECVLCTWSALHHLHDGFSLKVVVVGRVRKNKCRPERWEATVRRDNVTVEVARGRCRSLADARRQVCEMKVDLAGFCKVYYSQSNAVCVYTPAATPSCWERLSTQGPYEPFATWFGSWFEHLPPGRYRVVHQSGSQIDFESTRSSRKSGSAHDGHVCPSWWRTDDAEQEAAT